MARWLGVDDTFDTGVIVHIDRSTDNPRHPASVLLIEIDEDIEHVVLPADVWPADAARDELLDLH